MFDHQKLFITTDKQRQLFSLASDLADDFSTRAEEYDRAGSFPFENFDKLKEAGYSALTVPKAYGGRGISLTDFVMVQERLAQGDASTALGIGWHLGIIMDLAERREWDDAVFETVCREVVLHRKLINRAATEPRTGSPIRGGRPETSAIKANGGWLINGKKTFTTIAPVVDYLVVTATVDQSDTIGGFLLDKHLDGVTIDKTWDTLGMRGTGSEDLILDSVQVPDNAFVETISSHPTASLPPAWLLHIPACYLGIALATRRDVISFAQNYSPSSLKGTIQDVPHVQQKIGEIDMELMKARYLLYGVAKQWDENVQQRAMLGPELAAAKYAATNAAVRVVDLAMRIVGGTSIFRSKPFERYYRDVRAGIHNPPSDDAVLSILARRSLSD